jgi:NAD-dependent SIR2 family protein deacetylase
MSKFRTDAPVYSTRHSRVLAVRGRAAEQECTDCGDRAKEWSQRHGTDGTEPADYDPRCNACHREYDGAGAKPGELHHNAKLTEAQVRDIFTSTGRIYRELAEIHGVSVAAICDIRRGRRWRHVTAPLAAVQLQAAG